MLAGNYTLARKTIEGSPTKNIYRPEGPAVHVCRRKLWFIARPLVRIVLAGYPHDHRQITPGPNPRRRLISGNPDVRTITKGAVSALAGWAHDDRPITRVQIHGHYKYRKAL